MNNEKLKKIIIAISAILLVAIGVFLYVLFSDNKNEEKEEEVTAAVVKVTTVETTTEPPQTTTETTTATTPARPGPEFSEGLYLKAQEAHKKNSNVIGWIRVKNTNVDYPILQNGNNDYYMNHDFYGNRSVGGYIFMDYRNYFGEDEARHSDNMLIYGHNMGNGTMFNTMHRYKSTDFYLENPYIEVSSLYKDYQYKIYTCMLVNGGANTDFDFWNYLVFPMDSSNTAEEEFNKYKSLVDSHSIFETGVDLKLGDKIIQLSTCNSGSSVDQTRFVTVARRIRDGEDPYAGVEKCTAK